MSSVPVLLMRHWLTTTILLPTGTELGPGLAGPLESVKVGALGVGESVGLALTVAVGLALGVELGVHVDEGLGLNVGVGVRVAEKLRVGVAEGAPPQVVTTPTEPPVPGPPPGPPAPGPPGDTIRDPPWAMMPLAQSRMSPPPPPPPPKPVLPEALPPLSPWALMLPLPSILTAWI